MTGQQEDRDPQEIIEGISGLARGQKGERGDQGERGQRGDLPPEVRRAMVYLFAAAAVVALLALGGVFYSLGRASDQNRAAIEQADHQWCTTLALLTARPVPRPADPASNPSRVQAYLYYSDFLQLRHKLGCH